MGRCRIHKPPHRLAATNFIMNKKVPSPTLPYLDDFLLSIQANNYSPETLYNYERDLLTFDFFLQNELGALPFKKITKKTIEQFKAYLNSNDRKTAAGSRSQKRLGSASINRVLTSLRRYLTFLIDMDYDCPIV